jgi:hypothetical protein
MARRNRPKRKRGWSMPEFGVDWGKGRRALIVATWVLGAGGLAAAWVLGVPRLEAYASAQPWPDQVEVRYLDPPSWLEDDLQASLVLTAEEQIDPDPRNRQGLVVARQALLATGWFDEIVQVRRVNRGLVEIDARFARPFAVIRDAAETADHLVDPRARLLPRAFPVRQAGHYTAIVGAGFDRPSRPGEPWPGTDVTAALKVLKLIHGRPWRGQVAEINVAAYLREASISLVTDQGCIIRWGRAPGGELGGEVSAEQKLSYLDYHHQHYGHIDRGFLQEIDITGDVVIGR